MDTHVPEIFSFIQTDYPDTRRLQLRDGVNSGDLETIKDLVFQMKEERAANLYSKRQNPKRDRPLNQYETAWRALDGYSWEQAQKSRQGAMVPSGIRTSLEDTNLNPRKK